MYKGKIITVVLLVCYNKNSTGSLTTEMYFLTILEAGSPRSRCPRGLIFGLWMFSYYALIQPFLCAHS